MDREEGAAARAVSLKTAEVTPVVEAVIFTEPALVPKVYDVVAVPVESVVTVACESVPPAPPSLKVTTAPAIPLPSESLTLTSSGRGNVAVTGSFCEFPETIDTTAGGPVTAAARWVHVAYA